MDMLGKLRAVIGFQHKAPATPALRPSERGAKLLFRHGFLAHSRTDWPRDNPTWQALDAIWHETRIGSVILRTHPETELWHECLDDSTEVAIIGRAFSIDGGSINARDVASNAPQALRRLTGRFALLISRGESMSVFHDAFGARTIFYAKKGPPAFASHASLMACALGIPRDPAMTQLLETPEYATRIVKYLPGDATLYRNVFALVPNNKLNFPSMKTTRYWPDEPKGSSTFDEFFREIDSLFRSSIGYFSERYLPVFGITGGIDSRSIVAAWQRHDAPFRSVTWRGPYLPAPEIPAVNAIVSRLNRPHDTIEFSGEFDREIAMLSSISCGEFRGASRLTAEMYKLFGADSRCMFVRGYGGEIVRGF